jgi:hypothetical protein
MNAFTQAQLKAWLNVLKEALVQLRQTRKMHGDNLYWGKSRGIMAAGYALGLITYEECRRIEDLIDNALDNSLREANLCITRP